LQGEYPAFQNNQHTTDFKAMAATGTPMNIVVIGGVAGGMSAAARARRLNEAATIVVFEKGPDPSFANCGMPYYLGGEIKERASLNVQTPKSMKERLEIDVRTRTEVIKIDRAGKKVTARDLSTGKEYEQAYDHLILSLGASPFRPPIPGLVPLFEEGLLLLSLSFLLISFS
jgi:NADPH-dependent 2,4-dienoyl-CoA reductase/sulfur reductase-like enzyme